MVKQNRKKKKNRSHSSNLYHQVWPIYATISLVNSTLSTIHYIAFIHIHTNTILYIN